MNAPRSLQIPLWIIAAILLIQGLRVTWLVTLPVALALFIVALAWPLQQGLERRLRQGIAVAVTSTVIFAVFAVATGILALCVDSIVAVAPDYAERVQALSRRVMDAAEGLGLSLDGERSRQRALEQLAGVAQVLALNLYEAITILSLAAIFVVLALLEVHDYRQKLEARQTQTSERLLAACRDVAHGLRQFVLTRTFTSLLSGIATFLFTWTIGLDLPLVWGTLAFLLNYIPNIGSTIAVIPPMLLALLSPDAWLLFPLTAFGLGAVEFLIGNYLDPRLQGRVLSMSPWVLFFAMAFWGWVWGAVGAVLGVPITIALVLLARHFEATAGLSRLIAVQPDADDAGAGERSAISAR